MDRRTLLLIYYSIPLGINVPARQHSSGEV